MNRFFKRGTDIALALLALLVFGVPMVLIAPLVACTSAGPVLYWSERMGQHNRLFGMPKFRSMRTDTPELATHLLQDPHAWLTPVGRWLRRTSLDELPQLWSILRGDMSWVGPRPALHNQHDLIALRTDCGVHTLLPGLTGWAQINGRDDCTNAEKVALDAYYLEHQSWWLDMQILLTTVWHVLRGSGVAH